MSLRPAFTTIATKLQEASDQLANSDVKSRLKDALNDYDDDADYVDYIGDGSSGDLIYCCDGDMMKAPYEMGSANGNATCNVDWDSADGVVPRTTYEMEADDDDHYANMDESYKKQGLYSELPLYERFISKGERDQADGGDFAGKGKSFPILKPGDVSAAVHAMGRAGSSNYGMAALKSNIIKIAKRKGWTKYLPKAWRGDSGASESLGSPYRGKTGTAKELREVLNSRGDALEPSVRRMLDRVLSGESPDVDAFLSWLGHESYLNSSTDTDQQNGNGASGRRGNSDSSGKNASQESGNRGRGRRNGTFSRENSREHSISLTESAQTLEAIVLKEARADYEIKLIAPGKGSSAFYPAEVLKRDGPNVFKAGTHVYLNHPTAAEEAQRPEGDVKNLAGVLTTTAAYAETHAKGPGLYARMKVFADHGQIVEEKAPHVGMSIRASGVAESGKMRDGVPVLKQLTSAESVDVVTKAGAGGMILQESAITEKEAVAMTPEDQQKKIAEDNKKLVEAAVAEAIAPLKERLRKSDAKESVQAMIADVTLPAEAKIRVVETVMRDIPLTDDGQIDQKKLAEATAAAAKAEGQYLAKITGSGRVVGMGSAPIIIDAKEAKKAKKEEKAERNEAVDVFESLMGGNREAAKFAVKGRVA